MKQVLYFLIGLIFTIIGFVFFILYFNLFVFGYSLFSYLLFLTTRVECYFVLIGVIFILMSFRKDKKHDIHI